MKINYTMSLSKTKWCGKDNYCQLFSFMILYKNNKIGKYKMDWIGILVSYIYIGLIIVFAKLFEKRDKEISRKFIHIMLGNWWFIAMYFFTNVWSAMFVPITFIVINYISYKKNIIGVMERDNQDGLGTVYYAISLLILVIISFGIFKNTLMGLIPNLIMAYGDGLAGMLGKSIKSKKYKLLDTTKSLAGSLTMFIVSAIFIIIYFIFLGKGIEFVFLGLLVALIATLIEAISIKGIDNISVPMIVVLLFMFII